MTEQVTIEVTKFKGLDGKLYDTEEQCKRADRYWKEFECMDGIEDEVSALERQYKNMIRRQERAAELGKRDPYEGTKLVVAYEKHGNSHYMGTGLEGLIECYWHIFVERMDESYGYYSYIEGRQRAIAEMIFNTENKGAAYAFVGDRADYEYERVEVEHVTVVDQ